MAAKDIIQAKVARIKWLLQRARLNEWLNSTTHWHHCCRCGGIMQYGVMCTTTYSKLTGQPTGAILMLACENWRAESRHIYHDHSTIQMHATPFLVDYLKANPYILGVQTVLDVFEKAY